MSTRVYYLARLTCFKLQHWSRWI